MGVRRAWSTSGGEASASRPQTARSAPPTALTARGVAVHGGNALGNWRAGLLPLRNMGASFIEPTNGVSRKTRTGAATQRRVWRCFSCRKQFSVLTGTVFHGTRLSLRTWVLVIFEMCASKNGVSAREIERKYGVCPRTAWFMLHRICEAMAGDPLVAVMSGVIVADETWSSGDPTNGLRIHDESPCNLRILQLTIL